MQNFEIIVILILIFLISLLVIYYFLFNIYEVEIKTNPIDLKLKKNSNVIIFCSPINSLGWRIPFRKTYANFEITKGSELVEIVSLNEIEGKMILKSKEINGKVIVKVKPKYSILPSEIEIYIAN